MNSFVKIVSLSSFFCIGNFSFSFAQNLVLNPSFEQFSSCPTTQGQISFSTGWSNYSKYTPDYFNTCSPTFSVPTNWGGYQHAFNGNAYAGIYTYETPQSPPNSIIREFIGTQLLSPLIVGTKYYFSFQTSLALDSNKTFNHATNNLGMLFSTVYYDSTNPAPTNNFAHVYSTNVILDTINWIKISGSFIADSSYQYVIIGNFFNDANTIITQMQDTLTDKSAYYYIDDLYVSTDSIPDGVEKINMHQKITIYPIPFSSSITIENNHSETDKCMRLTLYNIYGIEIKTYYTSSGKIKIDNENFTPGIYFLKIESNNQFFTKKLIIE